MVDRTSWNLVGCLLLSMAGSACGGEVAGQISGDSAGPSASSSSGSGATDAASGSGGGGGTSGPGSSGAGGGGGTRGPGRPGCGFDAAAFCETFDAPAGVQTRAGELDPARWSGARMCDVGGPSDDGEAVAIGPATVPGCRSGLPAQVFPSQDALICDGVDTLQSNHLLVLVAGQNYGQNSYRIRQPFDFAGRTGTVVFDADGGNARYPSLFGWISLEVTEDPAPAPSFTLFQNFENGAVPRNGIEVQLNINCGGDKVGVGEILVYDDHKQLEVVSSTSDCPLDTVQGELNHFEVRLSKDHVAVYGSPPSGDGVGFGDLVLLGEADIALPFTRGYVHITTHNHATMLYSSDTIDAWAARWDNVGFDGPADTGGWREYEALDSLSKPSPGRVDVGWRLADASTGPAQTIEIHDVDPSGVVSARLALENWSLHYPGEPPTPDFALNYRLNGHAWKARKLTAGELQMMADLPNAGTRSMMLDVDVTDLAVGTNTLELTTTNAPISFYPPVVLNVDLVLKTQ